MAEPLPFEALLNSWPIFCLRRPVHPLDLIIRTGPRKGQVKLQVSPTDSDADLEQRYGDGHYKDRRDLLHDVLNRLPTSVDRRRICAILDAARCAHLDALRGARGIDQARTFFDERDLIRRNLTKWIQRALTFYASHCIVRFMDRAPWTIRMDNETISALAILLAKLDPDVAARDGTPADTLWTDPSPRRRRRTRGRPLTQRSAWVRQARAELRQAKVPRAEEDHLLIAVCLLPYR